MIQGLLSLHNATQDRRWLDHAVELARLCDELYWDPQGGGYFFAQRAPDLIASNKSILDGAIPSGNSAMVHDLIGLWRSTGGERWKDRARQVLETFSGSLAESPTAQLHMVHGAAPGPVSRWAARWR